MFVITKEPRLLEWSISPDLSYRNYRLKYNFLFFSKI